MLESVGSKASQETYPRRGETLDQVVVEMLVVPVVVRWIVPPLLKPARTRLESVGATAMALTFCAKATPARVHRPAESLVRQILLPPVHSREDVLGSMMKGEIKRPVSLVMPFWASTKFAPPSLDFRMERPVVST